MHADRAGFFASFCAGLIVCALVTGCDKEGRQKDGRQEPSPAQQAAPPGPGSATGPGKGQTAAADDESGLVGDWKGKSIVVAKNTAAKDEVVVWHIAKARDPGKLSISADKIVDGEAISMGAPLEFKYDKDKKTIVNELQGRVWKLTAKGNTMEGTLTEGETVFRRVTLEKAE